MMAVGSPASEEGIPSSNEAASKISSPKTTFPTKLYAMLQLSDSIPEFAKAVTWLPHGRAFSVLNKDAFMEDVVPIFFNQTKIRSFNRQLHLWGFRRIGGGKEHVWYHDNFLRGVPEDMLHMVRTKIKGDCSFNGNVPDFDVMPPLPICDKQPPSDVLNEMEKAILRLKSLSSSVVQTDLAAMPPNHNDDNVTDHQSLMHNANHPTFSSRSENNHSHEVGVVNFNNPDEERLMLPPISVPSSNFNDSQSVPFMHPHPPLPNNSMTYASAFYQEVQSPPTLRVQEAPKSDVCPFSPIKHGGDDEATFEPLPFRVDNNSCHGDDFSNFIESAIRNIEEDGSRAAKRT